MPVNVFLCYSFFGLVPGLEPASDPSVTPCPWLHPPLPPLAVQGFSLFSAFFPSNKILRLLRITACSSPLSRLSLSQLLFTLIDPTAHPVPLNTNTTKPYPSLPRITYTSNIQFLKPFWQRLWKLRNNLSILKKLELHNPQACHCLLSVFNNAKPQSSATLPESWNPQPGLRSTNAHAHTATQHIFCPTIQPFFRKSATTTWESYLISENKPTRLRDPNS